MTPNSRGMLPFLLCLLTCEQSRHRTSNLSHISIHNLDDDSLFHMFYVFRPNIMNVDEVGVIRWSWLGERWWYKLVQVCRRWRYLILGSASHLHLRLLCTTGTPVADMLAHSLPFPLIINYDERDHSLSAEEEEGMMLALEHHDRVECIYLWLPVPSLQKTIPAIEGVFPALEYLHIGPPAKHNTRLTLPPTFEAPSLRYLELTHFVSPIGSSLLSTATGLVILALEWIHPSTYPHPTSFLQQFLVIRKPLAVLTYLVAL
jgi:hypothetical protein